MVRGELERAEALMKHSCVRGVFSEESIACLREGSRVTIQEPQARPWKSNSMGPAWLQHSCF